MRHAAAITVEVIMNDLKYYYVLYTMYYVYYYLLCTMYYALWKGRGEKSFIQQLVSTRVVLDSWVVSQIWLDSDSNESSQSWVGRENQGNESSQSRITLIVIWVSELSQLDTAWVKVESRIFWRENVKILHLSVALQTTEN